MSQELKIEDRSVVSVVDKGKQIVIMHGNTGSGRNETHVLTRENDDEVLKVHVTLGEEAPAKKPAKKAGKKKKSEDGEDGSGSE
jgi:hypothetical protein